MVKIFTSTKMKRKYYHSEIGCLLSFLRDLVQDIQKRDLFRSKKRLTKDILETW